MILSEFRAFAGVIIMNVIGEFSITDSVVDFTTSPELYGARHIASTVINGTTYLYVSGRSDDGIQILTIDSDGVMSADGYIQNGGSNLLNGPGELRIVHVGNKQFLLVPSIDSDAVNSFQISTTTGTEGQLSFVDSVVNGTDPLDGVYRMESFTTPNGSFIAVSAENSDAVSTYRILGTGEFLLVSTIEDTGNADYRLSGAFSSTMLMVGGTRYLYVSGFDEDGINIFSVANNGALTFVDSLYLGNVTVYDIMAGNFNGTNLMVVGDEYSDDFLIYSIGADGVLTYLSSYDSYGLGGVNEIRSIEMLEVNGVQFVVVAGRYSDNVTVYSLESDGTMALQQSLTDGFLNGAYALHMVEIDGRHFVLTGASDASRITAMEIGAGNDVLVGTLDDDRIVGLAGNDDLIGQAGNDEVYGGDGDDLLSGRGGNDSLNGGADTDVLLGDSGSDTLEGGAGADYLLGGAGLDYLSYAGSDLRVSVNLASGTAASGDAAGDRFFDIEGLIGSAYDDVLVGDDGNNRLYGGGGDDRLLGGTGNDIHYGDAGDDIANGGAGDDSFIMGDGDDTANGGEGDDVLRGGVGRDWLFGGNGDDMLFGQGSRDILLGQNGNDTLEGGGGRDLFVFVGNFGADIVNDFELGLDQLSMRGVSAFGNFADVMASSLQLGADTYIVDGSNSIQLIGVNKGDLDAADFLF